MEKDFYNFDDLKQLMSRLRDKKNGCPWDVEQNFATIKPHTIEEAYEVADAIERDNMDDLKDELGDLLFQVIFHAQMASEQGHFNMDDVVNHVTAKMIFRHPHVFGEAQAANAKEVEEKLWEEQKAKEKQKKAKPGSTSPHYLDDVTRNLPALLLAHKIQKRVRKTGFKYSGLYDTLDKLSEEINELKEAYEANDRQHMEEELGDVLLVSALLATEVHANPEETLRKACMKFIKRFNAVEDDLKKQNLSLETATIDEMSRAWYRVKENSRKPS